jgi:Protein of unknown function (DUF4089)
MAKAKRKATASKSKSAARGKPAKAEKTAAKNVPNNNAPQPLDDFIQSAAQALDLKIERAWLPAVRGNLQVTLALGAMVGAFALPDDTEPAPVFQA